MRRAKAWGLTALGVLVALIVFDVGRRLVASDGPASPQTRAPVSSGEFDPGFRVGDKAPDFTLPDSKGKPHRLSELVRKETLLTFACGCANCIDLQSFTALMLKRIGPNAPEVITVTTMPTDREETYYRDTRLKQTLLYERKGGPVMKQYVGHPCPRVYHVAPDRTVTWIGSSPGESNDLKRVGLELAGHFGFSPQEAMTIGPGAPAPQSGTP